MPRRPLAPPPESRLSVRAVPFETAELFTIEATNKIWGMADMAAIVRHAVNVPKGCFVRVEPPEDVSEERVATLKATLLEAGAAAVRVMPRRKRSVVPQAAVSKPAPQAPREAAMALVARANTSNRAALKAAVEDALAASGL